MISFFKSDLQVKKISMNRNLRFEHCLWKLPTRMNLVSCTLDQYNCNFHYEQLTPVFSHEECVNRATFALKEIIMTKCFAQKGNHEREDISESNFFINTDPVTQEKWNKQIL